MSQQIPQTMRAVQLKEYTDDLQLEVVEKQVPQPKKGEVLIRMAASPINPSDLMFLRGLYGVKKELPVTPGFEGSGVVVATGKDWRSRLMLGKRVACSASEDGDGTWAEYMCTNVHLCIPLLRSVSLESGSMLIVNPLTAWGMMEPAIQGKVDAVVQTAAASALGRMVMRLGNSFQVPVVHVVRRKEQVELLRSEGAQYVLNSSAENFDDDLKEITHKLNATLALDAVAGEMTMHLLAAMPKKSTALVYGALSEQPAQVHPGSLIFESKKLEGFWLSKWMLSKGSFARMRSVYKAQGMLDNELKTKVQAEYPMEKVNEAIAQYSQKMTEGKALLRMGNKE